MVVSRDRVERNSKENASKRDDHRASDSWVHDVFLGARVAKMKREKAVSSFAARGEHVDHKEHTESRRLYFDIMKVKNYDF